MLKKDFIDELHTKLDGKSKKECAEFLDAFQDTVYDVLSRGEEVKLTGFGTFKMRKVTARDGVNPRTGEKIKIAEGIVPAFKVGSTFKSAVRG